jgi:hypothetical protein
MSTNFIFAFISRVTQENRKQVIQLSCTSDIYRTGMCPNKVDANQYKMSLIFIDK